jgi:uncharacterized protein (DUF2147 family)
MTAFTRRQPAYPPRRFSFCTAWTLALACLVPLAAHSASPTDAHGLWLSGDKAAVIRFAPCADAATALCGQIVWDKDAGTPEDACGITIARLSQYSEDAWRKGWVLDPRTAKHYKGVLRVSGDVLALRGFVGVEILGETEQMARVQSVPPGCKPTPAQ